MVRAALLLVAAGIVGLASCTRESPVPAAHFAATGLKPVAAQFLTVQSFMADGHRHEQTSQWRFWRGEAQLTSESLDDHTGELWQRDGATLFHRKLYHEDKRSIEAQLDNDQPAAGAPVWTQQALLVNPPLVSKLKETKSGWRDGYPYRRYAGTVDGAQWDIVVRVDWMLPVVIERRQEQLSVRTEATAVYELKDAPWRPTDASGYEVIDATDLGDRELDPFVQRVHREMGGIHRH